MKRRYLTNFEQRLFHVIDDAAWYADMARKNHFAVHSAIELSDIIREAHDSDMAYLSGFMLSKMVFGAIEIRSALEDIGGYASYTKHISADRQFIQVSITYMDADVFFVCRNAEELSTAGENHIALYRKFRHRDMAGLLLVVPHPYAEIGQRTDILSKYPLLKDELAVSYKVRHYGRPVSLETLECVNKAGKTACIIESGVVDAEDEEPAEKQQEPSTTVDEKLDPDPDCDGGHPADKGESDDAEFARKMSMGV